MSVRCWLRRKRDLGRILVISRYLIIYMAGTAVTLLGCASGYYLFAKWGGFVRLQERSSFLTLVVVLSTLYVVTFSLMKDLTVLSHHSYFDYAVFIEYFKNVVDGKGLYSTMQENIMPGTGHWFSVHFTPVAYLFSFLFWIWPSFHAVNWFQTFLLGLSPAILYLMARSQTSAFSAMCLSLALLLNPTLQYITLYEFDYLRFIIPAGILALGIVLTKDSDMAILLSSLPILLIREDAAFFVFGIGLYLVLVQHKYSVGSVLMVFSVVYLMALIQVVMPLFRGTENHAHVATGFFQAYGSNIQEIILNILKQPLNFLAQLLHPYKSANYIMFILPFVFVPLFGMAVLLIAVPTVMVLSFSPEKTYISYFLYYVSPVLVVVSWATVIGTKRAASWMNRIGFWRDILNLNRSITVERIAFSVLCGAVACSIYFGPSPISIQFWNKNFSLAPFRTTTFYLDRYLPTSHDAAMREIASLIPDTASVSAEQVLLHDVYRCRSIHVFPNLEKADLIIIDKKNPRKAYISHNPQQYYDVLEKSLGKFELIATKDGVYLYKRKTQETDRS